MITMAHRYWPLFDLRLSIRDLRLSPMTEADLEPLADLLPDDVEKDPEATRFQVADERTARGMIGHQRYWKAWGTWHPDAWELPFAVRHEDRLVGTQWLEATQFRTLRTVDSNSLLVPGVRGRGLGQQMRTAVLALAFGQLQARYAITSAWPENGASLGVSRALGYQPNGVSTHWRGSLEDGHLDHLVHLRLTREAWRATCRVDDVRIDGIDDCLPMFGLPRNPDLPG